MQKLIFCSLGVAAAWTSRAPSYRRLSPPSRAMASEDVARFASEVQEALGQGCGVDLVVTRGAGDEHVKAVHGRVVELKKQKRVLQLNYKRRGACDVARNFGVAPGPGRRGSEAGEAATGRAAAGDGMAPKGTTAFEAVVAACFGDCREAKASIASARTVTTLRLKEKGGLSVSRRENEAGAVAVGGHDRAKARAIPPEAPFLRLLNVTNAQHKARPGKERKLKQIFRFAELLDHALARTDIYESDAPTVVDMGCGKGYLTFAAHALLKARGPRTTPRVRGVEVRPNLVGDCNAAARRLGASESELFFECGRIEERGAFDVLLALHACDTATDDALYAAVAGGAKAVLVAPCCHKQVRPQLDARVDAILSSSGARPSAADDALAAVAGHGVLADRHAEAVTDSMRCLALRLHGFDQARIIEWISLEHTAKNTMIVATRGGTPTTDPADLAPVRAQLRALAAHHGVTRQHLCDLLGEDLGGPPPPDPSAPKRGRLPPLGG